MPAKLSTFSLYSSRASLQYTRTTSSVSSILLSTKSQATDPNDQRTIVTLGTTMAPLQEDADNTTVDNSSKINEIVKESPSSAMTWLKVAAASVFLLSAVSTYKYQMASSLANRRLTQVSSGSSIPSYIKPLMEDLKERKKLMLETPPEEVKYWFEYTGPLQVCYPQL
jgi:hypothetical protein